VSGDFGYFPGLFVSTISKKKPFRCVPTRIEMWGGLPDQMPRTVPSALRAGKSFNSGGVEEFQIRDFETTKHSVGLVTDFGRSASRRN
jgi:hypothetical protein